MRRRKALQLLITSVIIFFVLPTAWLLKKGLEKVPSYSGLPPYLRLHILANSDLQEDQDMKLGVRDLVLHEFAGPSQRFTSRNEAVRYIENCLPELEKKIEKCLENAGFDYDVSSRITIEEFPETEYGKYRLPAGTYLSLQLVLGEGKGHNWWCILYPPLCLNEINREEAVPVMAGEREKKDSSKWKKNSMWQDIKENCQLELKKIMTLQ